MSLFRSVSTGLLACLALALGQSHAQTPEPSLPQALSFSAASRLLLDGNRQIRFARRSIDVASSEIRRADVLPNPTLSASVSNTVAGQYRTGASDRILRLEQLIERGGKRELRVGIATAGERVARFELAEVVRRQRSALASAYYDLLAAQALVLLAEENAAGYARLVDAAERRLRAGDIAAVDVARLRVEASRARNDARAAQGALTEARIELSSVLGVETQAASLRATDDFPGIDELPADLTLPPAPERIDRAMQGRADVAAAAARVTALSRAAELALRLRTRDITVGVQTEHAPSFGGNVFGISASIPLHVNNDFSGDILRAQADRAQAIEDEQRIRATVRADIDRSAAQVATELDRARRAERSALPEARRAAEGMEFAFGRGASGLTDLFDARRQLAAVQAEAIATRAAYAKALAAYREALVTEELQ